MAALTKGSAPVHKITIVPRTSGALGYTMQVEEDERNLMTKEEAYAKIMTLTGGRCAEELIFDSITSGASNDIEQATRIARAMITRLGMSDTFGMTALETVNNQYLGGDTSLACSSETAAKIDEEVVTLIQKAHDEAKQLLKDNMGKLHELAKYLYEHETITGEEFMKILN
ncbi:MAG: cell division protein FtsH, partial [Merdibacter sp.]